MRSLVHLNSVIQLNDLDNGPLAVPPYGRLKGLVAPQPGCGQSEGRESHDDANHHRQGAPAGHLDIDATSYGGYWTHLGRSNWYIDAVLQGTYFQTSANSIRGDANNFSGRGFTGSIEAGYPIVLAPWLKFEPQIQGIWQRTSFDNTQAAFSTISFDRSDVFTGRAGALLRGTFGRLGVQWQPYLKGNVWWGSNGVDTVTFNGFGVPTGRNGGTTLEGGGGVTGKLTRYVSVYADASYLSSISGETRITLKGNGGLRVTW